jgi:hypothetical protein
MPAARLVSTDIPQLMSELGKIVADRARAANDGRSFVNPRQQQNRRHRDQRALS